MSGDFIQRDDLIGVNLPDEPRPLSRWQRFLWWTCRIDLHLFAKYHDIISHDNGYWLDAVCNRCDRRYCIATDEGR
jgi:hypothetical protein